MTIGSITLSLVNQNLNGKRFTRNKIRSSLVSKSSMIEMTDSRSVLDAEVYTPEVPILSID